MSVACGNRWIKFCFSLIFIGLVAYGPMVDPACSQTQDQNPLKEKNVLVLNAYESETPSSERIIQGLSAVLQSGGIGLRHRFYDHLGLARNPDPEIRKLYMQLIGRRYIEHKIDLIITLFPESLNFLLEMGPDFFPGAPVLALLLPQGFELPETDRQIISQPVTPDLKRT